MFTGIISQLGRATLKQKTTQTEHPILTINVPPSYLKSIELGASVAIDGVCLTVAQMNNDQLVFEVSQETLSCTTIGSWHQNHQVNLERPLKSGDEIGGHFVSGHVDTTCRVQKIQQETGKHCVSFEMPTSYQHYITRKGSVCINGVSLTVNEVSAASFSVNLIPHTLAHTNLQELKVGDSVNLEVDLLNRYLANLMNAPTQSQTPT